MRAEELLEICTSSFLSNPDKINQIAARNRSHALEYWMQCELVTALLARTSNNYCEALMEWYIPQSVAGNPKAPGVCDILLVDKKFTASPKSHYASKQLVEGVYIELKTSVHNDFSPRPTPARVIGKFHDDHGRVTRLQTAAKQQGLRIDAFLMGLVVDAKLLKGDENRPSCLAQIEGWFRQSDQLKDGLLHLISFGNQRGLHFWIWRG